MTRLVSDLASSPDFTGGLIYQFEKHRAKLWLSASLNWRMLTFGDFWAIQQSSEDQVLVELVLSRRLSGERWELAESMYQMRRIGSQWWICSHEELLKRSGYLLVWGLICRKSAARIYQIGVLCRLWNSSFPSKSPHGIDRRNGVWANCPKGILGGMQSA
jgi:hypothetical protein